jgi:hypothetical protein
MDRNAYHAMKAAGTLPAKGDTVRHTRGPDLVGIVIETFYENGEGGMHVAYQGSNGGGWACCTDVEVIARAS